MNHKANPSAKGVVAFITITIMAQFSYAGDSRPVKSLLEIRRENVVVQEWDLSCGAAALATLLHYQYGDFVTEKDIAKGLISREEYIKAPLLVKVRFGFSLLDLKRYVDARGYTGIGYGKLDLEDLIEKAPIITPIHTNGYNHFVIFRGVYGNRVLLADPAWGNRTMPIERFESNWIDYPELGKIGFVVESPDNSNANNKLTPRTEDFVTLF